VDDIPWNDAAIAICQPIWGHPRERVIVARGTLVSVIDEIDATLAELPQSLSISLPDRTVTPLKYDLGEIRTLLAARRAELTET
jgi:hypothetical protein